jgi:hypothetical protein
MLADGYQVADVLMLVGNIAPIALYFLTLGLINSHARPWIITSRADFLLLSGVLAPLMFWPVPMLSRLGSWWALAAGGGLAAMLFVWLLRKAGDGLVIYNISEARCARLVEQSLHRLGWVGRWEGDLCWQERDDGMRLSLRSFLLLRNVSLHVENLAAADRPRVDALADQLEREAASIAQLPSTMGSALVMVGLTLLLVPLWMVGRHIQDLVDAMTHLLG